MAEAWKVVRATFRDQVIQVGVVCGSVRALLANALPVLASPTVMHTRDAEGDPTQLKLVVLNVVQASKDLSRAISCMEAVELVALRGFGARPTAPLPSIYHLPDDDRMARALQFALNRFQGAKVLALEALSCVESCRGYLWAAAFMVGHPIPGLPGLADSVEAQRLAAVGELGAALQRAAEIVVRIAPVVATAAHGAAAGTH